MTFSYLMYTTPPLCSALRCHPMGTWTGTACLSSPASQSFPPFIAPLVLRSTPQRYIYQTSTGVFAMRVMFVFQSRGGGRVEEAGGAAGLCLGVGLCSRAGQMGRWTSRRSGRVRRARGWPYPLSCFMATALNCPWTSITASCHSEPSDSGRCRPWESWGSGVGHALCFLGKVLMSSFLPFVVCRPEYHPSVG